MVLTAFLSGARQENVKHAEFPVDQPSAIAFTAFADAWCSAIEMEIGRPLHHGRGRGLLTLCLRACIH